MEDQQSDSGDLTTGAVPQGKSGRRHRLPRQQLRKATAAAPEPEVAAAPAEEAEPAEEAAPTEEAEPAADEQAAEPVAEGPVDSGTEPVAETPRKRRFSWRRAKAPEPETPEPETAEPETPEPGVAEPGVAESETAESGTAESDTAESDTAEPGATAPEPGPEPEPEPEPEPILVPHRTAGRKLKVATVAAGVLFVAAAAFAGAKVQPYLSSRAEVQTKFEVAEVAANAITTLWTYTPDDMDTLPDRAAKYLGGDFAADYRRYIDSIVESNKQAQVSNATQVMGAAVESLTPTEASALVFTNSVATSPVTKGIPSLRYLSYRLSMERRDDRWLITRMTAVTSLDLTPRL